MAKKDEKSRESKKNHVKADVIILGCSLPGNVIAHKLKKKFGKSVDIVVLDLAEPKNFASKGNVAFQEDYNEIEDPVCAADITSAKKMIDNLAKHYLAKYAKDFNIPLPDSIISPESTHTSLNKLFQYTNGSTVECTTEYHDFDYLNFFERFELNQYQNLLDQSGKDLFQGNIVSSESDRRRLLYYDHTTMEQHICEALLFSTSREIMRMTVRLVCGAPSHDVSILFYLHQCRRTSSTRNHLSGNNTRLREKLLGFCRRHLASKLEKSVADITLPSLEIKKISCYSDEQVILETMKGETNYVCNLLAMAMKPHELHNILVEEQLLSKKEVEIACAMSPRIAKKFLVQYEEHFWREDGYSGDILSIRGPIIWAMERPKMSSTGSLERYAALVGYLVVTNGQDSTKEEVLAQLTQLFGEKAATPVNYKETDVADVFVPRCGDYIALRKLVGGGKPGSVLEWGAMDIFADGDVAASLEAGHNAYLRLVRVLRPQAQTYEDVTTAEWPTILDDSPWSMWLSQVNYLTTARVVMLTAAILLGIRLIKAYTQKGS